MGFWTVGGYLNKTLIFDDRSIFKVSLFFQTDSTTLKLFSRAFTWCKIHPNWSKNRQVIAAGILHKIHTKNWKKAEKTRKSSLERRRALWSHFTSFYPFFKFFGASESPEATFLLRIFLSLDLYADYFAYLLFGLIHLTPSYKKIYTKKGFLVSLFKCNFRNFFVICFMGFSTRSADEHFASLFFVFRPIF